MVQTKLPMNEARFLQGLAWEEYVAQMNVNRPEISQHFEEVAIAPEDRMALEQAVERHGGRIYVTAMTEDWCPDSLFNLPLVARIAAEVPGVELRIFVRSANPDLERAYTEMGVRRIPTISFFDSRWREIGRWVERPQLAHRRRLGWAAAHPDLEAALRSPKPEDRGARRDARDRLRAETAEWYRGGLWQATLDEIKALLLA